MASFSMPEQYLNPLQQRAAAAAQALLAPGRSISQREIQTMLEKNEAALRGWNVLHKQQPAKANAAEHKEWVRRCVTYRKQIGARLEVLASLADKQIALEDEKSGGQKATPSSTAAVAAAAAAPRKAKTSRKPALAAVSAAVSRAQQHLASVAPRPVYAPQQAPTTSTPIRPASTRSTSMMASHTATPTPPTMFPDPPMPVGFTSVSPSMFFPSGQMNPMQTSAGFTSVTSMAASGVATSAHGYSMSSSGQTLTPNAYMTSTSGPPSLSAGYVNQQNYMMGGGMMNLQQQQYMSMPMPMNLAGGNMYDPNYGIPAVPASTNIYSSGSSNNRNSDSNFPMDPFVTPLGFGSDVSFGSSGYPMDGMVGMPMQQQEHQMMGSMNGANFGAPMVTNNFGYGAGVDMPASSSQSMMPQPLPIHQFQPAPQHFPQQAQLPQQLPPQTGANAMSWSLDSVVYGENNVNIFEGLTDDAFFPMQ
ncbi:unnamed protein product [Hyaloperonospora brassicae]|uniref:Uncharacterized protein n=1 Tax=Hyaloperonospora brassicae TaxID=162125 RepID=A0AAV0T3K1_HYABA|nr:unnamed protein product [Hyaloperonospora brassicae]